MTLRVLCDTNVLVSALIADGPPSRLLEEAIDGRIELVVAEIVLDELARVLIGKLRFSDEKARGATDLVSQIAVVIPAIPIAVEPITEDAADNSILACALEAKADIVATGDRKHLLPLGEHRGVRLLTPQAALAALRTAG